jgi:UDP-sugar pyrophosphorylase
MDNLQASELYGPLCKMLLGAGQAHLFEGWDFEETNNIGQFFAQVQKLNEGYPGGITAYVNQAKKLLESSKRGDNPFVGFVPEVPTGATLQFDSPEYNEMEQIGMENVGSMAFTLVAGGLGERLGFSGIKVALPTEITTGDCYLKLYCESILALQQEACSVSGKPVKLPLAIMTSDDTHARTEQLLKTNANFGMEEDQIILLKQEKVASIANDQGHLARDPDNPYSLQTKPHGHGDVHYLLHSSGTAQKWLEEGRNYILFFQDTNGLVFRSLLAALGVAIKNNFSANSITGSRRAKEAMGAICRLKRDDGTSITTNVEYNQLDPLLRKSGFEEGDVNGPDGFSPFPGNMNQLLFRMKEYVKTLNTTSGMVPEFVNPKYADEEKTIFKKPTRLECMMQDLPSMFDDSCVVGFTTIVGNGLSPYEEEKMLAAMGSSDEIASDELKKPVRFYTPVKNNIVDAAKAQSAGKHPSCAASGEADMFATNSKMLLAAGVNVGMPTKRIWVGPDDSKIETREWPHIVLPPAVTVSMASLRKTFPEPARVKISSQSTLVLKGTGPFIVKSLTLDGVLVVDNGGQMAAVIEQCSVKTDPHEYRSIYQEGTLSHLAPEHIQIRGYDIARSKDAKVVSYNDETKALGVAFKKCKQS